MFLYILALVLSISYIGINTFYHDELKLDTFSNAHLKAQSRFFIHSIFQMANLCLEKYELEECRSDSFVLEDSFGGYRLIEDKNGFFWADIYIEKKNLRTSQVMRMHTKLPLPKIKQTQIQATPHQLKQNQPKEDPSNA